MLLLAREGRIALDWGIEVTNADILDFSGCGDMLWFDEREFVPFFEDVVSDPKGVFVDSFAFLLAVRW